MNKTRWLTEVALLAALIAVTGSFKLPGPIPGTEFQLSAPLAVAVAATFGFVKYIAAGMIASAISLILGTQNLLNVFVAMVFRVVAGGLIAVLGPSFPVVALAGPAGSFAARLALSGLVGKALAPLLWAALPGMLYTAVAAWPLTGVFGRIRNRMGRCRDVSAVQR